jgi:hypothetical protein
MRYRHVLTPWVRNEEAVEQEVALLRVEVDTTHHTACAIKELIFLL